MSKSHNKSKLQTLTARLVSLAILLVLIFMPAPAQAQWPPFSFRLEPSYEDGQITYQIRFSSRVEWTMTDVTFKIPLPEGTRFLEANAPPSTSVNFDGAEVTFFTSFLSDSLKNASFVVEVADPARTVFTTHAWIAWQGNQPGDYLTEDVSIDITNAQPALDWAKPSRSSVQLEAGASVAGDIITYTIYPTNVTGRRIWDAKVNVPVPEGTTFLSAEAPPPFVAGFDGREVSFTITELESRAEVGPLSFQVSTGGATAPFLVTHAWATWKNVGGSVGRSRVIQEEIRSGDIVVQPHTAQQVVSDTIGDVPFSNYDLTGLALQQVGTALKVSFYTAGSLGPVGEPLEYILYLDADCQTDTGKPDNGLGLEYRLRYQHNKGKADLKVWEEAEVVAADEKAEDVGVTTKGSWRKAGSIEASAPADGQMVTMWVPHDLLDIGGQFCWVAESKNKTKDFASGAPKDRMPNKEDLRLTQYAAPDPGTEISSAGPFTNTAIYYGSNPADNPLLNNPTEPSAPPSITEISGKLAVPLDNGQAFYDIHIFSLPAGQEMTRIPNARQPNFRFDGQRLLINREGGGVENVYEYNLVDGTERQVSDAPRDAHPFYNPSGNRVVYGNSELTIGADGEQHPYIYVQCGLLPPHQETESRCRDIPSLGILVPAGQMGEIRGTQPVWTANDTIAYKGCNSWAGFASCGIYIVPSASTKGFSDGFIPRQLTQDTSDIPTDTKGNLIAFMSHRDGNWEVYVMDLDGNGVRNLSNSPDSNDGLPTISPDGNWIAFVSDRGGRWAVWVASIAGSPVQKMFDLPVDTLWGDGDRTWTNERISWGP